MNPAFSGIPRAIPGFEGSFNNGGTKSYTFGVFEDKATGKPHRDDEHAPVVEIHPPRKQGLSAALGRGARLSDSSWRSRGWRQLMAAVRLPRRARWRPERGTRQQAHAWTPPARHGLERTRSIPAPGKRADTRGHHPCYAWGYERGGRGRIRSGDRPYYGPRREARSRSVDYLRVRRRVVRLHIGSLPGICHG